MPSPVPFSRRRAGRALAAGLLAGGPLLTGCCGLHPPDRRPHVPSAGVPGRPAVTCGCESGRAADAAFLVPTPDPYASPEAGGDAPPVAPAPPAPIDPPVEAPADRDFVPPAPSLSAPSLVAPAGYLRISAPEISVPE